METSVKSSSVESVDGKALSFYQFDSTNLLCPLQLVKFYTVTWADLPRIFLRRKTITPTNESYQDIGEITLLVTAFNEEEALQKAIISLCELHRKPLEENHIVLDLDNSDEKKEKIFTKEKLMKLKPTIKEICPGMVMSYKTLSY